MRRTLHLCEFFTRRRHWKDEGQRSSLDCRSGITAMQVVDRCGRTDNFSMFRMTSRVCLFPRWTASSTTRSTLLLTIPLSIVFPLFSCPHGTFVTAVREKFHIFIINPFLCMWPFFPQRCHRICGLIVPADYEESGCTLRWEPLNECIDEDFLYWCRPPLSFQFDFTIIRANGSEYMFSLGLEDAE
jgi:hypothetical protein